MGIQINGQTDTVTAIDGSLNVGGDVTIPGVLTYDDVTNVDSIGVVTARSSVNVGASGNPHGKLHVYTDSLNADNGYNGQNFGIVVETEDGDNDGDEGNGICFTQQYSSDGIDSGKVRTGAIIGFKDQATGNFGGGLKFKVQQFGATPLLTSMVLDRSGNIGIGTDNPNRLLHLKKSSGGGMLTIERTDSNSSALVIAADPDEIALFARDSDTGSTAVPFVIKQGGSTEALRITSDGKVGIGTTIPNGDFEVFNSNQAVSIVRGNKSTLAILGDDSNSGASETDARIILCSDGTIANNLSSLTTSPLASHGFEIALINEEPGSGLRFHDGTVNAERLRITSSGNIGIGTNNPGSKLTVYQTGGNAKLQLQRSNTANDTDDYGSILWRSAGGTAVGGINVARQTAENDGYMFFQTTESGSSMTERLRILADGTIRKGTANSGNAKAPVELFFQKRSTQIGKRVHQGSGSSATTHDILNIDSWQSGNSHAFIYVTVYYVSPVANYGGRMECYAHAVNSGGSVSGGQGTFATASAGRWGNPGTPSLSWSGSTLQFTTFAHAYIDYSLDITCIAYDGAVVSYYSN